MRMLLQGYQNLILAERGYLWSDKSGSVIESLSPETGPVISSSMSLCTSLATMIPILVGRQDS